MPFRSVPLQILSLVVLIFAVYFAYQASVRWEGFSSIIKEDWDSNFRAGVGIIGTGKREETMGMAKTPVYLYVWTYLLEFAEFGLLGYMD